MDLNEPNSLSQIIKEEAEEEQYLNIKRLNKKKINILI